MRYMIVLLQRIRLLIFYTLQSKQRDIWTNYFLGNGYIAEDPFNGPPRRLNLTFRLLSLEPCQVPSLCSPPSNDSHGIVTAAIKMGLCMCIMQNGQQFEQFL